MDDRRRALADWLARRLARLLPPERADWAEAMRCEAAAVDQPGARLGFVLGCLWACFREGMVTMDRMLGAGRQVLVLLMLGLAAVAGLSASRTMPIDAGAGLVFAGLTAAFATAALWSWWRGAEALVQAASTMLALHLVAFGLLRAGDAGALAQGELYRALSWEGTIIWAALLAGGLALLWLPRATRPA